MQASSNLLNNYHILNQHIVDTIKPNNKINNFGSRITVVLMAFLVLIFTMMPEIGHAQRRGPGGPSHGGPGHGRPGGPSHMHHHPSPHRHIHPIGLFVTTLAVTAIVVTVVNKNKQKEQYKYDNGTYYKESSQNGQKGYVAVPAPIGAKVPTLPSDNTQITVNNTSYYYYASTFYTQSGSDYVVVQPPPGAIVPYVPDGYVKKEINGVQYYLDNNIYYLPKSENGDIVYEVVEHP